MYVWIYVCGFIMTYHQPPWAIGPRHSGLGTVKGIHRFPRVGGHNAAGIWEAPGVWVCHHHVLRVGDPASLCISIRKNGGGGGSIATFDCQRAVKHPGSMTLWDYGTPTSKEVDIKPGGCLKLFADSAKAPAHKHAIGDWSLNCYMVHMHFKLLVQCTCTKICHSVLAVLV